jgi:tyrosine-protein phosphatase non-receptor type 11
LCSLRKDEKEVAHIKINCENNMYDIGGGQVFKTLESLVETYKHSPMVEASGRVVRLKQPVNATRFITGNIHERMTDLMKVRSETYGKTGFWEEFEQLQQQECKNLYSRKEGSKPECRKKNRYKNILPFDATRVKLKDEDPEIPGSDYINANYITDGGEAPPYIATQGCVPDTVNDFWRMVYQENTRVIVMTTNEMERGKVKCQRYWPELQTEALYGDILVQTMSEEKRPQYILRELQVQKKKTKKIEEETVPTEEENHSPEEAKDKDEEGLEELKVEKPEEKTEGEMSSDQENTKDDSDSDDDDDEDTRTVYHYHFIIWPDHGVPHDPANVLVYLEDVNQKQGQLKELELEPGPVVVHCSAGIGRTGTFIVIDMLLRKIEQEGLDCEVDIQKTILSLRSQRSGMVQTEAQYKFIYMALAYHIQTLKARNRVADNYDNRTYPPKAGTSSTGGSSLHKPDSIAAQQPLYTNLEFKSKEQNGTSEVIPALPPKSQ